MSITANCSDHPVILIITLLGAFIIYGLFVLRKHK